MSVCWLVGLPGLKRASKLHCQCSYRSTFYILRKTNETRALLLSSSRLLLLDFLVSELMAEKINQTNQPKDTMSISIEVRSSQHFPCWPDNELFLDMQNIYSRTFW